MRLKKEERRKGEPLLLSWKETANSVEKKQRKERRARWRPPYCTARYFFGPREGGGGKKKRV